jgi:hypothetical protein
MVLLGDEAQVEACFGPFGDSANLDARVVHCLLRTYYRHKNHFGHTQWNSYVMWVMSNIILIHLDTVLVLVNIGARFAPNVEIVLDTPGHSPR